MPFCMSWSAVFNGGCCPLISRSGKAFIITFGSGANERVWQRLPDRVRADVRRSATRHKHPTAGCLDSQSVKTTQIRGVRGFDAGKNVNGRKRHLLVDTLGLLMTIVVTAACVQEREGARLVFARLTGSCKKLRRVWVDGGYRGSPLAEWVAARFHFVLQVVLRGEEQVGFVVLPRRWVAERTFG